MNKSTHNFSGRRNPQFSIHVGSASLLMIFVILCLVSFATLSIVSANADRKLTDKVLERTDAYYDACNEAEAALSAVDETLESVYASTASEEEYFATVGHDKSYAIPISELQKLQVTIKILYPTASGDPYYRITNWQVLTSDSAASATTIIE